MGLQRLLDEAQLVKPIRRISIHTNPSALAQFVMRGEREGVFALQVRQQRKTVEALEDPAIGTILLLTGIGLATGEEAPLPFQEQELRIWTRPDRWT
jgi:hypothetical protein